MAHAAHVSPDSQACLQGSNSSSTSTAVATNAGTQCGACDPDSLHDPSWPLSPSQSICPGQPHVEQFFRNNSSRLAPSIFQATTRSRSRHCTRIDESRSVVLSSASPSKPYRAFWVQTRDLLSDSSQFLHHIRLTCTIHSTKSSSQYRTGSRSSLPLQCNPSVVNPPTVTGALSVHALVPTACDRQRPAQRSMHAW